LVIASQFEVFAGRPAPACAAALGPSSAAPPAAVIAFSALALPICQSSAAPAAPAAAQSIGLGGLIPAAAATPAFSVHVDGDVQTHDGPVDKVKLATVPTTLPVSTGRNPEK